MGPDDCLTKSQSPPSPHDTKIDPNIFNFSSSSLRYTNKHYLNRSEKVLSSKLVKIISDHGGKVPAYSTLTKKPTSKEELAKRKLSVKNILILPMVLNQLI